MKCFILVSKHSNNYEESKESDKLDNEIVAQVILSEISQNSDYNIED